MALATVPVVIEVRKGDKFPIEVLLDSRFVKLHTEGTWMLEALDTFYILLKREGPPVLSADGKDFDSRQGGGSFGLGFEARKDEPAKVKVVLKMNDH